MSDINDNITMKGRKADSVISVQDGSGRLQWYWNVDRKEGTKYMSNNEPAFKLDIPIIKDPYLNIKWADKGKKNNNIEFENHLSIKQNGNVGMGVDNPTEKLEVSGNIKSNDLKLTTNNFQNRLAKNTDFANSLYDTMHNEEMNIYEKIRKSCSTIKFKFGGEIFTGSGNYITLTDNDLKYGIFLTAAHCVMGLNNSGSEVEFASEVWITNPINNKFYKIDTNKIYYDGIADVAIIRTDIDLTNNDGIPLRLSNIEPRTGDICFICGNPGGFDNISFSRGVIRDANFFELYGTQITNSLYITTPGIGGNSGSAILDKDGNIIGIYTFGERDYETFAGGSNLSVLNATLPKLLSFPENKRNSEKKYLGITWDSPGVYWLSAYYYSGDTFDNKGVYIYKPNNKSPFKGILKEADILLSASVGDKKYDFGDLFGQYTPGILCYEYNASSVILEIRRGNSTLNLNANLNVKYGDVDAVKDMYLSGGIGVKEDLNKISVYPPIIEDKSMERKKEKKGKSMKVIVSYRLKKDGTYHEHRVKRKIESKAKKTVVYKNVLPKDGVITSKSCSNK